MLGMNETEKTDILLEKLKADSEEYKGLETKDLVAMVLNLHDLDVTKAEDAYRIIQFHNRKNLKATRADI